MIKKIKHTNYDYSMFHKRRANKSSLRKWPAIVYIFILATLPLYVMAVDGCSDSGKVNICCENAGMGPTCA